MRWSVLWALGLHLLCELEGREGTMGHLFGLITLLPLCMAVHHFG